MSGGPGCPPPAGREGAARDAGKAARDGARARLRHARRAVGAPPGACAIAAAVAPNELRACGVAGRASSRAPMTRRIMGVRQEGLIHGAPRLLRPAAGMGAAGCALPAELLPCAAALLLPLLLLPPERVRALELQRVCSPPGCADEVSVFLSEVVVSARHVPVTGRPVRSRRCCRDPALTCLCGRAGRLRPARGARRLRRVPGGRARVRRPGALHRGGAAHAGRELCVLPGALSMFSGVDTGAPPVAAPAGRGGLSSRRLVRACAPEHDGQSAARGAEHAASVGVRAAQLQCLQAQPARADVTPARRARRGDPVRRARRAAPRPAATTQAARTRPGPQNRTRWSRTRWLALTRCTGPRSPWPRRSRAPAR